MKLPDLAFLHTALFMYDFHSGNLPASFTSYFTQVNQKHNYNTRLASKSSYSIPKIRTNFGKFNIRYSGAKCWNLLTSPSKIWKVKLNLKRSWVMTCLFHTLAQIKNFDQSSQFSQKHLIHFLSLFISFHFFCLPV